MVKTSHFMAGDKYGFPGIFFWETPKLMAGQKMGIFWMRFHWDLSISSISMRVWGFKF
jgi:hypothetical protein